MSEPAVRACTVLIANSGKLARWMPRQTRGGNRRGERGELDGEQEVEADDAPRDGAGLPRDGERDEDVGDVEATSVGEQRPDVDHDEDDPAPPRKRCRSSRRFGRGPLPNAGLAASAAPTDADRQQRPRHDAGGTGGVPPELAGHVGSSVPGTGRCGPAAGEAGRIRGHHGAVVVDGERRRRWSSSRSKARGGRAAARLGQHLGRPRVAGEDGGLHEVGLGGPPVRGRSGGGATRRRTSSAPGASSRWRPRLARGRR